MEKVDYKKTFKHLYHASDKKVSYVDVPEMKYIQIEGKGSPEGSDFHQSIEVLYKMAYTLKFMFKDKSLQPDNYHDYVVPPLEALWCMDGETFDVSKPDEWKWISMILQPDFINESHVKLATELIRKKKEVAGLKKLKLAKRNEGKAVQMMHIGPYNEVGKVYIIMERELKEKDLKASGAAHEIYLSDPRRVANEKLKTIARMTYR